MTDPRYRFSRCIDPRYAPQKIHWATVDDIKVQRELVRAVSETVPRSAIIDAIADINAVLDRVETCEALDPEDVKNITRDRELFEIRINVESFGLLLRLYTVEPNWAPHTIVVLRVHAKHVTPGEDPNLEQDKEIDEASRRRVNGLATRWGLV